MTQIMDVITICLLWGALFTLNGCVSDEKNIFGVSASERMRQALEEYRLVLTNAENGWFMDYYPEKNQSVGGYSMYLKFLPDGRVIASCEVATNLPPSTADTSLYDLLAEQGPVLSFSTYNKVMHFFSEPYMEDVNGREGDYEFVIVGADRDEVALTGKKRGTMMKLHRNTNKSNPKAYFDSVTRIIDEATTHAHFKLVVGNRTVDSLSVKSRRMKGKHYTLSFAYTSTGVKFHQPFVVDETTMWNFALNAQSKRLECTDPGAKAYFEGYYPAGHQLKYNDFLGDWKISYTGYPDTTTQSATVNISVDNRNFTYLLSSPDLFSFAGIKLSYEPETGTIALLNHKAALHSSGLYNIRVCAIDMNTSRLYTEITEPTVGLTGIWNGDQNGQRQISFKDNKVWRQYSANGFILLLYPNNSSAGNYYYYNDNKGGMIFSEIKIIR